MNADDFSESLDLSEYERNLSVDEITALKSILTEISLAGRSSTLDGLWEADYEEVPVDIYTFITDKRYLGESCMSDDGNLLIYKFWVNALSVIFAPESQIMECGLSGAIGLGKSTIACIGLAYVLYKLLCLKNPAAYYRLTKGSRIAIAIFNISVDQGFGVGFSKLQSMLMKSPWFLEHGSVVGTKNQTYYPGKNIDILVGSKMEHFIGRDVFCLTGDTKICTEVGVKTLEELAGTSIRVLSLDDNNNVVLSSNYARIEQTALVNDLIELELDDGTSIRCTPEHRLLLASCTYKQAKDISTYDKLVVSGNLAIGSSYIGISNVTRVHYAEPVPVYDVINAKPNHNFLIKTQSSTIVSHNCGFLDEVNFAPGSNPKVELSKIMKLYTTIKRRMESRYMKLGKIPGILFLVSSKKSDSDFLEQYLKMNKDKPYLYVVDEPIWVVKADQGLYCGKKFHVAVGNKYLKSKILSDTEDSQPYRDNGQEVIDVPIEYREAFELDINSALMDIAGKALSSSIKYIYYDKLKLCYRDYLKNPFSRDELIIGFDDDSRIQDYLVMSRLSKIDRSKPHFIHWDTSKSGDATGLAMATIAGHREVKKLVAGQLYQDEDIIHKVVFAINIRPEPGNEIPFYKIRNFIYYLRYELGYNIVSVTCDSFQSVDTLQQLSLHGFNTKTLSMDRSRVPYDTLKNAINEGRLLLPYVPHLEKELLELEDDKVVGKIDHPADGSKDTADAVAGAVYRSLDYKELVSAQNAQKDVQALVNANKRLDSMNDWIIGSNNRVY